MENGPLIAAMGDERAVLGVALAEGTGAVVSLLAEILPDPKAFARPGHEAIWRAILAQAKRGEPCDPVAIRPALAQLPEIHRAVVDPTYLLGLAIDAPVFAQADYYAQRVALVAQRRTAHETLVTAVGQLERPEFELDQVLSSVDALLTSPERLDTTSPHLPGLPSYPWDALIGPLADLVGTGSATGLPVPYLAGAGLAALATVAGNAELQVSETWIVRPVLWIPLIGPAGSAKTPSINAARAKLRELDSGTAMDFIAKWEDWQSKPAKDRDDPPRDDRLLVDDATLEAVALRMSAGDGTLGVDSDELSEWLSGLSRYRSGGASDRTRWLSSWSSSPWTVDRAGGRKLHIPRPVVTVCGGLQPHLTNLLGPDGDGMRPRWLPHPSTELDLKWRPGKIADSWGETITQLYGARHRRIWALSPEAMKIWESAKDEWKSATRGSESPSVIAALAKADEQTLRVALVLAESQSPGKADKINADQIRCAISIIGYVLDVWRAMPGGHAPLALSRRDEILDAGVDALATWLENRDGSAPRREIQRARVAGARVPEEVDALLRRYEAVYPGSVRNERSGSRGPKAVVVYAPRRSTSKKTVTGDSLPGVSFDVAIAGPAGQGDANSPGSTVTSGDSSFGDGSQVTVNDQGTKIAKALTTGSGERP